MKKDRIKTLTRGALAGSGAAFAVALVAARAAAGRLTAPAAQETRFLTPWELRIPYEEVSFQTEDGLRLCGWWLPNPEAKRSVITLAGYNSARHHTLGISSELWRRGANVLLFDNRGRGDSEGDSISLGHHERLDARAAVEYTLGRAPGLPLGVFGFSMGGSVALMVAADDRRIGAVVADSPFASQRNLIMQHLENYTGPLAQAAYELAHRFVHYDIREVEPVGDVTRISPRPILLIHGEEDSITSPEDSRILYEAAGEPKELWLVPGAGHIEPYFMDREAYCDRVGGFFEKRLDCG